MTSPDSRTSTPPAPRERLAAEPSLGAFRPTFAVVDLDRLAANWRELWARVGDGVALLPVVKADAYGHGAVPVARRLADAGAAMFAVALAEEGHELRSAGIEAPILLLGVLAPGQLAAALDARLTPSIFDRAGLERLDAAGRERGARVAVHVKVDTGMGRIGFPPDSWDEAIRLLSASRGLEVAGVFTNFASADDPPNPFTAQQVERLDTFVTRLSAAGLGPGLVHASNSAGLLAHPSGWKGAVRPGLALYGLHPGTLVPRAPIDPVLSLETELLCVKEVATGTPVGYAGSWIAARPSRIATLPIGYDDGYPRAASGRGRVLLDSGVAPVVGRVSMDMTMIDVTDHPDAVAGAPATMLGRRGADEVDAAELAGFAATIPYEILCGIGRRVPRVVVEEGRVVDVRSPFAPFLRRVIG